MHTNCFPSSDDGLSCNPYLSPISWSDVAAYNGLTGSTMTLKKYASGQYATDNQTLQPYEGGFVFAATAISNVEIPFRGQTDEGGRKKNPNNLSDDIDSDKWEIQLTVNQGTLPRSSLPPTKSIYWMSPGRNF